MSYKSFFKLGIYKIKYSLILWLINSHIKDLNNSIIDTPTSNTFETNSVQQAEVIEAVPEKKANPLLLILIVIIVLLLGIIAYLVLSDSRDASSSVNNVINNEEENKATDPDDSIKDDIATDPDDSIKDDIATDPKNSKKEDIVTKEYYNEKFGVKLSYPTDWVIIEEQEEGDVELTLRIGATANSTKNIFLYEIKPSEIDTCIYSEANLTVSDGPTYEVLYDNFVNIGAENNYRRSFAKYGEIDSFIVCKKGDDNIFRKGNPEFITYWNFDQTVEDAEEELEILDKIVLSYEYIGK